MDIAYLTYITEDEQIVRGTEGDARAIGLHPGMKVPLADTFCARVLEGRVPDVMPDTHAERDLLSQLPDSDVRSYVGVPVRFSDGRLYGTLCCASSAPAPWLRERDVSFVRVLAQLLGQQLEREELERERDALRVEADALTALLAALDARDSYTSAHSVAVVDLAAQVAEELGLPASEVANARQVAMLHDIGKLGVPDAILGKPSALDSDEWSLMRQHSVIGAEIVASVDSLSHLAPAIRAEHERCDGAGYPDGLVRDEIPLASRIAFACDAFHAMTSQRPYRGPMEPVDAARELELNAGTQFDAEVVAALLRIVARP